MSLRSTFHPVRILQQPLCVRDLAAILELRQSNVSNHLKLLRECGLLEVEHRGPLCVHGVAAGHRRLVLGLRTTLGISDASDPVLGTDAWNSQRVLRA